MIPINVQKQTRQQVGKAPIPLGTGAFETQMERRTGGIIAQGINNVGAELDEYVANHKAQDVATDQAAFAMHYKNTMTDAKVLAEKTSDPDEVHKIYQAADRNVSDYLGGKNQSGTPNIRWQDHQDKAKLNMSQVKSASHEMAQRRVLDIYKDDSRAKHQRLGMEFIETEDAEGLRSLGPVMRESGLYTPEEVNLFVEKGEQAIEQKGKARGFNAMRENLSQLEYGVETGEVSTEQEIDALTGMTGQVESIHEDYQPIIKSQIYSRLSKAYRVKKTELNDGFHQISSTLMNGNYQDGDLDAFLAGRLEDYNDLVLAAGEAEEVLEGFAAKRTGGENAAAVVATVRDAMAGTITIDAAVKELKDKKSKLGPVGLIMLGAGMVAGDSGTDPEGVHNNWTVKENTIGPWNKTVPVTKDSLLAETVRMMGLYVADREEDAGFVKKVFFKAVDIQKDPKLSDAEKLTAVQGLFKEKALDSMRPLREHETDIKAVMDSNPTATRAEAEQYLKNIGRW